MGSASTMAFDSIRREFIAHSQRMGAIVGSQRVAD